MWEQNFGGDLEITDAFLGKIYQLQAFFFQHVFYGIVDYTES